MKKFILVLGGARSGKSAYAVRLAKNLKKKVVFIATAAPSDSEMQERIKLHKASRPRDWGLIEEAKDIETALSKLDGKYGVVLIDCLGLAVSNLMAGDLKDKEIGKRIGSLISAVRKTKRTVILVSNDVGSGIVPANPMARRFRDLLGLANQLAAKLADEVILMQAGIPVMIK
ncbi:MAG: bifunctional adenosylcobinamide kinase/adenosylcobinamide-phosphate guanylyltransferase [Candidatus Omnitrophica bacterium]|nr:bifunctional adenosylcobinamide kinase/adenosylcobinamide-phosphate guanylyltransferase [Candidatus Omnitrophota bacterium]